MRRVEEHLGVVRLRKEWIRSLLLVRFKEPLGWDIGGSSRSQHEDHPKRNILSWKPPCMVHNAGTIFWNGSTILGYVIRLMKLFIVMVVYMSSVWSYVFKISGFEPFHFFFYLGVLRLLPSYLWLPYLWLQCAGMNSQVYQYISSIKIKIKIWVSNLYELYLYLNR